MPLQQLSSQQAVRSLKRLGQLMATRPTVPAATVTAQLGQHMATRVMEPAALVQHALAQHTVAIHIAINV